MRCLVKASARAVFYAKQGKLVLEAYYDRLADPEQIHNLAECIQGSELEKDLREMIAHYAKIGSYRWTPADDIEYLQKNSDLPTIRWH